MIDTLRNALTEAAALGGPVVLILIAASVVTFTVAVYKIGQFSAARVGRHAALSKALAAWDRGETGAAQNALAGSRSYLRDLVQMGMEGACEADRLRAEAEARFARLERGFRLLDTVAQLAPLLGLFGTVLGMISAFRALQDAGSQVDPSILAGGIWVALLTTAAGLAVAMPTSIVLSWLEARMDAERSFAESAIQTLLDPQTEAAQTQAQGLAHAAA